MPFDFILTENNTKVDLSVLQDLIGDDIASLKPIIELFLNNMPVTIAKMKEYERLNDWDNLYKTAHYAKSSVSVVQVEEIYRAAAQIESMAKNRSELNLIQPIIHLIEQHFAVTEKLLRKAVDTL